VDCGQTIGSLPDHDLRPLRIPAPAAIQDKRPSALAHTLSWTSGSDVEWALRPRTASDLLGRPGSCGRVNPVARFLGKATSVRRRGRRFAPPDSAHGRRQMSAPRGFLGHHVPVDVSGLAGSFVVEIGIRQAWPFVGFCDNRPARSRETRLYIDADWSIDAAVVDDVEDDERWLLTAARLNGANVVGAYVDTDGTLNVETDEGHTLVVSGEATASTVGEPWGFSGWQRT